MKEAIMIQALLSIYTRNKKIICIGKTLCLDYSEYIHFSSTSFVMVQIKFVLPFPGSAPIWGSPSNSNPSSVPKSRIS